MLREAEYDEASKANPSQETKSRAMIEPRGWVEFRNSKSLRYQVFGVPRAAPDRKQLHNLLNLLHLLGISQGGALPNELDGQRDRFAARDERPDGHGTGCGRQ